MRLRDLLLCMMFVGGFTLHANASTILFTNRDVFDATVQPNREIVFDADSGDCVRIGARCDYTYDSLLALIYDVGGVGLLGDRLGLGPWNGQTSGYEFLEPITAIGFDLVEIRTPTRQTLNPDGTYSEDISPQPAQFGFAGTVFQFGPGNVGMPQFFGASFDQPTTGFPAGAFVNYQTHLGGSAWFAIKNLSVKTVPEPSTLLLLGLGVCAVARRRPHRPAA
jgi:hypothetical protein